MCDQDDGEPDLLTKPIEETDHASLHGDVERGRRLVGNQDSRTAGERRGDRDPLPHATGELVRECAQRGFGVGDAYLREQIDSAAIGLCGAEMEMARMCSVSCRPIESIG